MSPASCVGTCPVGVRWEPVPSELGGNVSRASWVGNCPVQVVWERVPSELGGNLFHQSCVGTCPVRVGWEIVPCKLDGNVSRWSWVRMLEGVRWERVPCDLAFSYYSAYRVGKDLGRDLEVILIVFQMFGIVFCMILEVMLPRCSYYSLYYFSTISR